LLPQPLVTRLGHAQFEHPRVGRLLQMIARHVAEGEAVIRNGPGTGLRIDASGRNAGYALGTSDFDEQEWLAAVLRPGDSFYDIGANIGFLTLIGSRLVGQGGTVVAFEPLAENIQQLRKNIGLNRLENVRVEPVALSSTSGSSLLLFVPGRRDQPRLLPALEEHDDGIVVEVPVASLDECDSTQRGSTAERDENRR
jgi:FkbM family methyltransferase